MSGSYNRWEENMWEHNAIRDHMCYPSIMLIALSYPSIMCPSVDSTITTNNRGSGGRGSHDMEIPPPPHPSIGWRDGFSYNSDIT